MMVIPPLGLMNLRIENGNFLAPFPPFVGSHSGKNENDPVLKFP
jgi:hypothetical protein